MVLGRERAVFLTVVAISVPALVWAGVQIADGGSEPAVAGVDAEPGISHVHGLGVNPADGALYIATHHGTFRLASGADQPERVGTSYQDTMGFTVTGPDEFLGSGHPDLTGIRQGRPKNLGLIGSTDAGGTWTSVSLGGEVDFHALTTAHGLVYGWDSTSGRVMVTRDRKAWEERSVVDLHSFAVDPADADHLVATRPEGGLLESKDGGRTWSETAGPKLTVLSWDGDLIGADADGQVYRGGESPAWQPVLGPLPGEPQAVLGSGASAYVAIYDHMDTTAIYRVAVGPDDAPRAWELVYREP